MCPQRPEWTCGNCIKRRRMGPPTTATTTGPLGQQQQQQQQPNQLGGMGGPRPLLGGSPQQQFIQPQQTSQNVSKFNIYFLGKKTEYSFRLHFQRQRPPPSKTKSLRVLQLVSDPINVCVCLSRVSV